MAGYTVSARDWQLKKDGKQWMVGKTFDIDVASGAETHQIRITGPFYPLAFSPDGKFVGYVPFQGVSPPGNGNLS